MRLVSSRASHPKELPLTRTGNIWSHLLATISLASRLWALLSTDQHKYKSFHNADILAVTVYYIGCINCFLFSTLYHVLANHSKNVHDFVQQLDHLGIAFVIYGTSMPATYFLFYCDSYLRNTYWTASTTFALASAVSTIRPRFREPAYRTTRFYIFSLLGLSCFLPILHGLSQSSPKVLDRRMGLYHFIALATMQFCGSACYAARIPERFSPRTFDIVGFSHQIMHVTVVVGALIYEKGLLQSLERWNDGRNICQP